MTRQHRACRFVIIASGMQSGYAILLLLLFWNIDLLGQPEVLPIDCVPKTKFSVNPVEKDSLIELIKTKENPACGWKDRESGFDNKVRRLVTLTTPEERIALFKTNSLNLKYYLFPSILLQDDSTGFELLKNYIGDTSELGTFCSCISESDPIGLRLARMYYGFIDLKYNMGTNGTIGGISFWIVDHPQKRPSRKIWRQKFTEFKDIAMVTLPTFKYYLFESDKKNWH